VIRAAWLRALGGAIVALALLPVAAQLSGPLPDELEGVGVTQKLDAALPLEQHFFDENGQARPLGDYFHPGRPVLLVLAYYRCPMLCGLVLQGLLDAVVPIDWLPGREFEIVVVSIDPTETPALARQKKQSTLASYGRPESAPGWHFLTGDPPAIEALADAAGFGYNYVPERKEYAHPAVLHVVTPQGRLSRYLLGVEHDPRTLRLALVEASAGRIGTMVDQFVLYCSRFDAAAGRYTAVAWRIMRVGGILTVLALGIALAVLRARESLMRRDKAA
jgi:protein SCO1/2